MRELELKKENAFHCKELRDIQMPKQEVLTIAFILHIIKHTR